MTQSILVVGDPIRGITLYTVDGPRDPQIEQRFANETWWVVEARPIARGREVLHSVRIENVESVAGRMLTEEELDLVEVNLHNRIMFGGALREAVVAVTGSPADDDSERIDRDD